MSSEDDAEGIRAALRRLLNPLDVVVITRDRLQDALDDAVRRGRMTRDDATELLGDLLRRARRQTEELLADEADAFPIAGYDDLTAAEVIERLRDLEAGELRRVREYERRNANRKTVLGALDAKLD
jgi:polyhydroxyalkanoate synthesis regulator phasin